MDEGFPQLLQEYDAVHVRSMGWKGLKNGALLQAVQDEGFDSLITIDKQMRHQQRIVRRTFSIIVLDIHPSGACCIVMTRLKSRHWQAKNTKPLPSVGEVGELANREGGTSSQAAQHV
jgi:hypothetical protein